MPVFLTILLQAALQSLIPLAITIAQKTGLITKTDAVLVLAGSHVLKAVEATKVEDSYPDQVHAKGV